MEKANLIFTYYDNIAGLRKIADMYQDEVRVLIVDDGSPTPLRASQIPTTWQLYRITEDIGWNAEGARNLAMHVTDTKWNVLLDMAHPLTYDSTLRLPSILPTLDENIAYNPVRQSDGKRKNAYIITKDTFWRYNGYDETYTGLYGYDETLSDLLYADLAISQRKDIQMASHNEGKSAHWSRTDKSRSCAEYEQAKKTRTPTDQRLRFKWERVN